jgi:phage shock protein PspC (stress-responsive transcriptional regulator)
METIEMSDLALSNQGRQLQGVCAGLAAHYGSSVESVRLGFAVLACMAPAQTLGLYLLLGLALPWRKGDRDGWLRFRVARWFGRTFTRVAA